MKLNHLHIHQLGCPLLHSFCRAASIVIPLLPEVTFTPIIQPNLCSHTPLTTSINTLLAILYSSILSTCTNHLNTLWSTVPAATPFLFKLFYTPSFFIIHSWHSHPISQTLHLKDIHFPSLRTSHTPCLCYYFINYYNYYFINLDTSWHFPLSGRYYSAHFSELPTCDFPLSAIAQHTFQRSPRVIFHSPLLLSTLFSAPHAWFSTLRYCSAHFSALPTRDYTPRFICHDGANLYVLHSDHGCNVRHIK